MDCCGIDKPGGIFYGISMSRIVYAVVHKCSYVVDVVSDFETTHAFHYNRSLGMLEPGRHVFGNL